MEIQFIFIFLKDERKGIRNQKTEREKDEENEKKKKK